VNPAVFEQIPRDRWKEVDKIFNTSLSVLEKFIQRSKLSGTHDDLADTIPYDNCDPGILYLYFSMREIDGLTNVCMVTEEKRKKEIVDELATKVRDKKKARMIIKRNKYEIVDDSDIEDDSEEGGGDKPDRITESQGELVEQYHAAHAQISFIKSQMVTLTKTA